MSLPPGHSPMPLNRYSGPAAQQDYAAHIFAYSNGRICPDKNSHRIQALQLLETKAGDSQIELRWSELKPPLSCGGDYVLIQPFYLYRLLIITSCKNQDHIDSCRRLTTYFHLNFIINIVKTTLSKIQEIEKPRLLGNRRTQRNECRATHEPKNNIKLAFLIALVTVFPNIFSNNGNYVLIKYFNRYSVKKTAGLRRTGNIRVRPIL